LHGGRIKCIETESASEGVSVTLSPGGSQFILHASENVVVAAGSNASMVLRTPTQGNTARLQLKYLTAEDSNPIGKTGKKKKKKTRR